MKENNITVSISCNNLNLYTNDTTHLILDIKNNSDSKLSSVFLKLVINSEYIEVCDNNYNINKNEFLFIDTLNPYELREFHLNIKVKEIISNTSVSIQSVLNYMIKNQESYTKRSVNSNILNINLKTNDNSNYMDSFADNFMENTCLSRSIEAVLEENPCEIISQNILEPYLVGLDNTSNITKECNNKDPHIGDIITFTCYIKNLGNLPCRNLVYEEDTNSYLEFVDNSLHINDISYSNNIFYGIKISNFNPGDELNISYKLKVIDSPKSKIITPNSRINYSYLTNQNIEHKSIIPISPIVKVSLSSYDSNLNYNLITNSIGTFKDVLNIATYSLNIIDISNLKSIKYHSTYNCSFRIENNGNMNCNSISLKINLPECFTYVEDSLYSNGNYLNTTSLDDYIYLNGINSNEFIDITFSFKLNPLSDSINDSINIEIDSTFMSYSLKEIKRNYSKDLNTLEIENTIFKELSIDSNYKINSDESTFYKIINIESDAYIESYRKIVPRKYNSSLNRNSSNNNFLLKGFVTNKIQYKSLDNSINTINRETPFSVNLSLDNSINPSDLIAICNNVHYKLLNKKLILVSNSLSIQ